MDVGESVPLDYSTTPSGNWSRTVSGFYAKSSNTSVVTIGSDMILTAVGEGTATITIGTDKGMTATCQVTVGSVDLEECEVTLASASYTYDGTAKKPAVPVTYGGKTLTKGKTYYVRIRTYKTVNGITYYSAWSEVKSVKISK